MRNNIFYSYKLKFKITYILDLFVEYYLNKRSRLYNDHKLVCFSHDKISTAINLNGVYEKRDLNILTSFLNKHDIDTKDLTVLDIGANIGNHSIYFHNFFKKVISFEPLKTTFEVLKINTSKYKNIEIHNFGISDQNGEFSMKIDLSNIGGSKVVTFNNDDDQKFKFYSLDYLNLIDKIGMIKIDVEGHEYEVLKGAENTIKTQKPIVLFELNQKDFVDGKPLAYNLLKEFGYRDFYVIKRNCKSNFGVKLFDNLFSFILSTSVDVRLMDEIKLTDYPFIIAMPEKYNLNFTERRLKK